MEAYAFKLKFLNLFTAKKTYNIHTEEKSKLQLWNWQELRTCSTNKEQNIKNRKFMFKLEVRTTRYKLKLISSKTSSSSCICTRFAFGHMAANLSLSIFYKLHFSLYMLRCTYEYIKKLVREPSVGETIWSVFFQLYSVSRI